MSKYTNPLDNVSVASPCSQDWNEMIGTERKRFCGECKLNVYNLSGMSRAEAERLLLDSEGRLCVRFYRRADGSVLTKDCPVGWQALKRRVSRTATAFASLFFAALSGVGLASLALREDDVPLTGAVAPFVETPLTGEIGTRNKNSNVAVQGEPLPPVMGNVAVLGRIAPPKKRTPDSNRPKKQISE